MQECKAMMKKVAALACTLAVCSASGAMAASVNTMSNVVFIVDESGSMGGEQAFLRDFVIDKLDADLLTAGVTSRSYGIVGYGGTGGGDPRAVGGTGLSDSATTKANLATLNSSGSIEDGYEAIQFAIDTFTFTAGAAVNFILVTDEDRDVAGGPNLASIQTAMTSRNILLNAVINNPFTSDNGASSEVIGMDSDGTAYLTDGLGSFTTDTGATIGNGVGNTEVDYAALALATGGAAWNLNILRDGGNSALSFGEVFVDIKVSEIVTQQPTPPIPLPAGVWLMISGLGALGVARRARKAKAA